MASAIEVLPREIDGDGVLGLHVVEAREDQAQGLLGRRDALETGSGARRVLARESCDGGQGSFPFVGSPGHLPGAYIQDMRARFTDSTSLRAACTYPGRFRAASGANGFDHAPACLRCARSAVEDSGDFRPCRIDPGRRLGGRPGVGGQLLRQRDSGPAPGPPVRRRHRGSGPAGRPPRSAPGLRSRAISASGGSCADCPRP